MATRLCDLQADSTAEAPIRAPEAPAGRSGAELVPREATSDPQLLTGDAETARDLPLGRGQYRISGWMEMKPGFRAIFERNLLKAIKTGDEAKRVHYYKIEFLPTQRLIDGAPVARFTVVVHVIDNPVWLVPLLWGAVAATTAVGGWLLVDKVETFTETGTGKMLSIAAALVTIFVGIRFFRGGS